MIKKFLKVGNVSSRTSLGLLLMRFAAAAMMLTHGLPKFQRLLEGNLRFGDPLGIGSELSFILVVFAEFICSILLIVGAFSRFTVIPLAITMLVAFSISHADDPFGTREKPMLYFAVFIVLLITGPGKYSLDKRLYG